MKSQQEILEERLKIQRTASDRSEILNQRVSANRTVLPSKKEKAERADSNLEKGEALLRQDWVEEVPGSAKRFEEAVGFQATMRDEVRPAIAFGSGILTLDLALGGGIPCGTTEIYGKEGVGKTTLIVELVHAAQAHDIKCALCCGEYFDHSRYDRACVDLDRLVLIRGTGEDVLEIGANFISEGPCRALFMDSATMLRPKNDNFDNWRMMMLSWMEYVTPLMHDESSIVMVNQVRARKSIDPRRTFAGGTDSAARRILDYFHARLEISKDNDSEKTYDMIVNIVANVLSAPAKLVTLPTDKRHGIDVWKDVVRVAAAIDVVSAKAGWYKFHDPEWSGPLGHGEEDAARRLEENCFLGNLVYERTMNALRAAARSREA
jgi:RecA/RadA recombinase